VLPFYKNSIKNLTFVVVYLLYSNRKNIDKISKAGFFMKSNKFFIAIILTVFVMSGTSFEIHAVDWRDYIPTYSTVSARLSGISDWASKWATTFVSTLSEHKKKALLGALIAGYYLSKKQKQRKQKEDKLMNCERMKEFVKNYKSENPSLEMLVEYDTINKFLKKQRNADVSWSDIACLDDEEYLNKPNAYKESFDFLRGIHAKFPEFRADRSLQSEIKFLESVQ
jgi:hypothetical protein